MMPQMRFMLSFIALEKRREKALHMVETVQQFTESRSASRKECGEETDVYATSSIAHQPEKVSVQVQVGGS